MHCSNLYWNTAAIETAEIMINHSILIKYFCNSGAEAIESA